MKNNKGNVPVYGASKESDIPICGYSADNVTIIKNKNGEIKKTKVRYFNDCLTFNIDGLAGYVFYREGRFSLSKKVRPLIIKEEFKDSLNPIFLIYIIEPIFRMYKGAIGWKWES
ncbi:restriction endonuclease subunit S [Bacillus inaquosorum]|uniref:restriction endonuclease subunit S n=1 Tax=Bacillus inaquosorum TaxID=483913 RepID=UPI003990627B